MSIVTKYVVIYFTMHIVYYVYALYYYTYILHSNILRSMRAIELAVLVGLF